MVHDELIADATSLRQLLSVVEAKKVSDMIDMEDAEVFYLKKTVSRWFNVQVDAEQKILQETAIRCRQKMKIWVLSQEAWNQQKNKKTHWKTTSWPH